MNFSYEINKGTMCLFQESEKITRVIERDDEFLVEQNIKDIINTSCKNFGSSFEGRIEGTANLTGIRYKSPIIVSEYLLIIILPTTSPKNNKCYWFSLHNIKNYEKNGKNTIIEFISGKKIEIKESYFIIQNQISKALRLDYSLRKIYKEEK